jgi:hypothetical protein
VITTATAIGFKEHFAHVVAELIAFGTVMGPEQVGH